MDKTVRDFCKFVHERRPAFATEFRAFIRQHFEADRLFSGASARGLIIVYLMPLMSIFAELYVGSRLQDRIRWKEELFPRKVKDFIIENAYQEFFVREGLVK